MEPDNEDHQKIDMLGSQEKNDSEDNSDNEENNDGEQIENEEETLRKAVK